jgi:hypothetical protein
VVLWCLVFAVLGVAAALGIRRVWDGGPDEERAARVAMQGAEPVAAVTNAIATKPVEDSRPMRAVSAPGSDDDSLVGEPTSVDPGIDPWSLFPRSTWNFVRFVWDQPSRVLAADLFRHVELNPTDAPIPESDRVLLEEVVRDFQTRLAESQTRLSESRLEELTKLRALGLTTQAKTTTGIGLGGVEGMFMPSMPSGSAFTVQFDGKGGGDVHFAPVAAMPETRRATDYQDFLAVELGKSVVGFFSGSGLCPVKDSQRLLESLGALKRDYSIRR